jgi:hypothetical protein
MPPIGNTKYPNAGDMPEMNTPPPGSPDAGKMGAGANPVIQALQTIQTWIMALEQKQDPTAGPIKQAFMAFVQALQSGGGGAGAKPPAPGAPPAGGPPGQPPVPGGAPGPNAIRPSPMNAAGNPSAKPMI